MNKYLPVGSVIKVKNQDFVIVGYLGQNSIDKKYYDYICAIFPFGMISNEYVFFNQKDIERVEFIGYQNGATTFFSDKLHKVKEMIEDNKTEQEIKEYLERLLKKDE